MEYDREILDENFYKIVNNEIDYKKIYNAMNAVGWWWAITGTNFNVPTSQELKNSLVELYLHLLKSEEDMELDYPNISSGGWVIEIRKDNWPVVYFNFACYPRE